MRIESTNNKRKLGSEKEALAARYLAGVGYEIIEKNFRCMAGEIDLIAKEGSILVFIEVKFRKDTSFGYPEEAIGYRKQKRMIQAAGCYLKQHGISGDVPMRFDAVVMLGRKISVIPHAFEKCEKNY